MRFGVPDAKLEKSVIDRRVAILEAGGRSAFVYDVDVGRDVTVAELQERSRRARDRDRLAGLA